MSNMYMNFVESGVLEFFPDRLTDAYEWQGHIPFAYWLIKELKPRQIVELGTYKGDSYLTFCQTVQSLNLNCRCAAIDTWAGDGHVGQYGDEVFNDLRQYHDSRYASFSRLHRMLFDQAIDRFEDGEVDLLHIDGLHTYEAVKHDFESWYSKLSNKSVVIMHDSSVKERGFGVETFLKELKMKFKTFEFFHSNGLAVIKTGADVSDNIEKIFETDANESETVRQLFKVLGDRVQLNTQVEFWKEKSRVIAEELEREKMKVYFSEEISELANFIKNKVENG